MPPASTYPATGRTRSALPERGFALGISVNPSGNSCRAPSFCEDGCYGRERRTTMFMLQPTCQTRMKRRAQRELKLVHQTGLQPRLLKRDLGNRSDTRISGKPGSRSNEFACDQLFPWEGKSHQIIPPPATALAFELRLQAQQGIHDAQT